MRKFICCGVIVGASLAAAGCSQITVTSDTLVNGTARIANASTDAVRQTSNATTRASNNAFAQNDAARRKFVHSQYAALKSQAARGQGEDLDALAYLMRKPNKQAFAKTVQTHYAVLFSGSPSASVFLSRLYRVVGTPSDAASKTISQTTGETAGAAASPIAAS